MAVINAKITHVDDKTVHYELPFALPMDAASPVHPISGYLSLLILSFVMRYKFSKYFPK